MPLVIQDILPRSLAAKKGIKPGDKLLSINGHDIRDFIDLQFYGSDSILECELETADGELSRLEIQRNDRTTLGIEPETYKCTSCLNNCVFCFIDQMPSSLRDSLYVKDDDYLYSFVFGNYISLTNLDDSDYKRIVKQKLSPLYVSVHTTNADLRRRMMGYPLEFDVLAKLRQLSRAGIRMHCQIVLVPGWNDGDELLHSLEDLLGNKLKINSIGIVPVGLTRFRKGLNTLRSLTKAEAARTIEIADQVRERFGTELVYCADELFIQADIPIPESEYYGEFPQVENGIGMVRLLLENWKDKKRTFLKEVRARKHSLLLVTGLSAQSYIQQLADDITSKADCCPARVVAVSNEYMGRKVTVSGLLTFEDIRQQVVPQDNEIIVLPGNIFNHDGITLDGFSQPDIKEYWQKEILIVDPLFDDWEWI